MQQCLLKKLPKEICINLFFFPLTECTEALTVPSTNILPRALFSHEPSIFIIMYLLLYHCTPIKQLPLSFLILILHYAILYLILYRFLTTIHIRHKCTYSYSFIHLIQNIYSLICTIVLFILGLFIYLFLVVLVFYSQLTSVLFFINHLLWFLCPLTKLNSLCVNHISVSIISLLGST